MRRVLLALVVCSALATPVAQAQAGSVASPVVFTPKRGTMLNIEGRGPFRGSLELRRTGGTMTIINTLDLDHYVMGVREVPGGWPMEALKAQAVAARTYVLWEIANGFWKQFGFDVCATVSCQVYQGATAEQGERGRRWAKAVRDTSGEVLLHEGRPALARYHSSSGGRTLANKVVFPSDGDPPYLRGIDDPYDRVSPLHRWTQRFHRDHLQRILREAIGLGGTITDIRVTGRKMRILTKGGHLDLTTVRFRRVMSETAPDVYPSLYPGTRSDDEPMPFTMPSSRFTIRRDGDAFVIEGRGYGHGVGMSQWGAMGRAEDGHSYKQILAAYYPGLEPTRWTGERTIRVAISRSEPSARIFGTGLFSVASAGSPVDASTVGTWDVSPSGLLSLALAPPGGHEVELAITGVRVPPEVIVDPPQEGRTLDVSFVVPKAAQVIGVVELDDRTVVRHRAVVEAGERRIEIPLEGDDLPGRATYRVRLEATDGDRTVVTPDHEVVLAKPGRVLWKVVLAVLLVLLVFVAWRRRAVVRRRRLQATQARIAERAGTQPRSR